MKKIEKDDGKFKAFEKVKPRKVSQVARLKDEVKLLQRQNRIMQDVIMGVLDAVTSRIPVDLGQDGGDKIN